MLPKHNEILRLDINLTLTAMKVPRLGLQVNYTQDSSRHNDNAETLELVDINAHSEKMRK